MNARGKPKGAHNYLPLPSLSALMLKSLKNFFFPFFSSPRSLLATKGRRSLPQEGSWQPYTHEDTVQGWLSMGFLKASSHITEHQPHPF